MHLIRLLSVSDTFTAGEIPVGRYRVVGLKVLPRFSSAGLAVRAPVRPTRRWHRMEAPSAAGKRCEPKTGMLEGAAGLAAQTTAVPLGGGETAIRPPSPGGGPEAKRDQPAWWRRGLAWLSRRFDRSRNPFGGSGLRVSRTTRPRQGTLSLEAVQVVCNDLKDSDFDLVAASSRVKAKPAAAKESSVACDFQDRGGELPVDEARLGGGGL